MLLKSLIAINIFVMLATTDGSCKNDTINTKQLIIDTTVLSPASLYNLLGSDKPRYDVFERAYLGFISIKDRYHLDKNILTIIDYELPSVNKRLWVINIEKKQVLFCELVAHGKKSGENYAEKFSNIPESNMSSLGFFKTGDTYYGKHGLSLYLDGIQKGVNDKARERNIVIHGAEYVSQNFIKTYGRLGRSLGCPALPYYSHKSIINIIKDNTCVYVYGKSAGKTPDDEFLVTDFVK